ncbi:MAG: twin-arginine translocase subunit TatC [Bdellovibrionales bacterium]|nr:twin-arginine translocase subunit TatC [Bdellovibrionales bacterium]
MSDPNLSLTEHLKDLRDCIIRSFIIVMFGFLASWAYSETLFDIIRKPIQPFVNGLVFTGVMDKFIAHMKVSLLSGIIITCPLWLYQVWRFVKPGLYQKEKKAIIAFLAVGTFLFLAGVAFVYFIVFPFAFEFLMSFAGNTDSPMITIDEYLSFFISTTLMFGVVFELPLALTLLGMLGIVNAQFLRSSRRYALVVIAIVSAVITPPDVLSMVCIMVPLQLLYELSIFSVAFFGKRANTSSTEVSV